MQHKRGDGEKTKELQNMFVSLDENEQEQALNILRILAGNQANAEISDLKCQNERQAVQ